MEAIQGRPKQENQKIIIDQIKDLYVDAYFEYKRGWTTINDFSQVELQCMLKYLELFSSIQPYYSEAREQARTIWEGVNSKSPAMWQTRAIPETETELISLENGYLSALLIRYESEYIRFRSNRLELTLWLRFLNSILNDIFDHTGRIQPYFDQIHDNAEAKWKTSKERTKLLLDSIQPVKKRNSNF